jgi:arylsulfatase
MNTWPDAGMTPFRNEKNSNWEGAYRVPAMVRWPGVIPAGRVLNGIVSHTDWFITLLAAAGNPDIAAQLRAGHEMDGRSYKVHLDGFNQLAYWLFALNLGQRDSDATRRRCAGELR